MKLIRGSSPPLLSSIPSFLLVLCGINLATWDINQPPNFFQNLHYAIVGHCSRNFLLPPPTVFVSSVRFVWIILVVICKIFFFQHHYSNMIQQLQRIFEMTEVFEVVDTAVAYGCLAIAIPLIPFNLRVITALPRTKSTANAVYMIYQVCRKKFSLPRRYNYPKSAVLININFEEISGRRCNRRLLFIQQYPSNTRSARTSSSVSSCWRNSSRMLFHLPFLQLNFVFFCRS